MESIPKTLKKNYPTKINQTRFYGLLNQQDPSKIAWKHTELQKAVRSESLIDRVHFYNDLLVQPVLSICFWLGYVLFPDLLKWMGVVKGNPTKLTFFMWILSTLQILWKFVTNAMLMIDYHATLDTIHIWKVLTHYNGGPFITGPEKYEVFLYADAIARLKNSLQVELQTSS